MSLCQQPLPGPFIPISKSTGPFHTTTNISTKAVLCEHPRIRPEVSSCAVPSVHITSFYAFNFQSLVQPVGTYSLQSLTGFFHIRHRTNMLRSPSKNINIIKYQASIFLQNLLMLKKCIKVGLAKMLV